jgi:aarF domain-containing kinase
MQPAMSCRRDLNHAVTPTTPLIYCTPTPAPTPGNLLRTPDGKLCILDWGLVTTVNPDLQLTLIEHVAHLTASDYAKVPGDLVKLGFVPEGAEATVIDNGVVDFLTYTYSTWKSGGGAAKLDVPKLFSEVRELAAGTEGGIFQVPPYFAYIAKSFSVLEGIGLSVDPNYSIVDETLPYISQRILTDPSPRTAGALETFIFGDAKDDKATRVLDAERVGTLVDGAKRYTSSLTQEGKSAAGADATGAPKLAAATEGMPLATSSGAGSVVPTAAAAPSLGAATNLEDAADAILDLLLSREASPLQEIAIEQSALLLGAFSRERFAQLRKLSGTPTLAPGIGRSRLGLLLDPLGLFRNSPLVENDERDRQALAAAAKLAELADELLPSGLNVGGAGGGDASVSSLLSDEALRELAQKLVSKLFRRRDDLQLVTRRFTAKLFDQTAERVQRRTSV